MKHSVTELPFNSFLGIETASDAAHVLRLPAGAQYLIVKMGDMIWVKVLGVDERGKIKLSRKAAMKERDEAAGNGAPAAPAPAGAN